MPSSIDIARQAAHPDDTIYELKRIKKRPWWFHVIDMFLSDGMVADTNDLAHNLAARFYLVANPREGAVLEIADHSVLDRIPVPSWHPSMVEDFHKTAIDGYVYRRVRKVD